MDSNFVDPVADSGPGRGSEPPNAPRTLPPGHPTEIGGYRILSLLGEGGVGAVYEAEQAHPHRRVALKLMRTALASADARRRFTLEGELLGRLRHPAIAQIYEVGSIDSPPVGSLPYFAMEFVEGGKSITDYAREHDLSLHDRIRLALRVLEGIHHGHQRGVIHRDLKPENILIDAEGNPKIIDFGLARRTDSDDGGASGRTVDGQLLGTPEYMSPEQFSGDPGDIDVRTDVYSIGVVLFELFSGRRVFDVDTLSFVDIWQDLQQRPGPRLSSVDRKFRGDLDTIVATAMAKDRERRYPSVSALIADLRCFLDRHPIAARRPSALYQIQMFSRRHKGLFASALAVILVLVAGVIVSSRFAFLANRRADEALHEAYRAQILGAADAIEEQRIPAARDLLTATPPELRGWEFRHLSSRLDLSLPSPLPPSWRVSWGTYADASSVLAVYRMLSEEGDGEWIVLDLKTLDTLLALPSTDLHNIALSLDGSRIVWVNPAGSKSRTVSLWDIAGQRVIWRAPVPAAAATASSVCWHPSGDRFMVASLRGFEVRDGRTGDLLGEHEVDAWSRFTADEMWIVSMGNLEFRLIDARTLRAQPTSLELESAAFPTEVAAWGSWLAVGMYDGTVRLLEIVDGVLRERRKLEAGSGFVTAVGWSGDGRLVAMGSNEGRIRVWDRTSGDLRDEFDASDTLILSLIFLEAKDELLSFDADGRHRAWTVGLRPPGVLSAHRSFVYPVDLSPDGSLLLSGGWDGAAGYAGGLKFWDARTGAPVAAHGFPGETFFSADLTPDGRYAVAGVYAPPEPPRTDVIDLVTGAVCTTFHPEATSQPERTIAHPDGRRVLSTFRAGEAYVWDLATGDVLWETNLHVRQGHWFDAKGCAAISPDGRLLAFGDGDLGIRIVDAETYEEVRRWEAHDEDIWSLSFRPDGKWILSPSEDDTVGVWETATGRQVATLVGHGADVLCAAVSPDGTRIASGGRDGYVRLWDTDRFECIAQLGGHESYIYSLVWSPSGDQLFSSSGDGTVRLWQTRPLAAQVAAETARKDALPRLEAQVARLLAEGQNPHEALDTLIEAGDLDGRERELARQVLMGFTFPRAAAARGESKPPFGPAWYRAPRAAEPVVIDGRLDEATWREAPRTEAFVDIEGAARPAPRLETRARLLWDDESLYVGAWLADPHVWGTLTERDSIVFNDNDFEVFIDPEGDGRWYVEIEVNALGTIFDLQLDRPYREGGRPHPEWSPAGLRAAVAVDGTLNDPSDEDRGWTVEIAIPHAALAEHASVSLPPRPGDVWRVNFSRVAWLHDVVDGRYVRRAGTREDNWVWTPQFAVDMHRPRQWGFVEFLAGHD